MPNCVWYVSRNVASVSTAGASSATVWPVTEWYHWTTRPSPIESVRVSGWVTLTPATTVPSISRVKNRNGLLTLE